MKSRPITSRPSGFGLLELMLAMALGIVVAGGVVVIFIAERQVYQDTSSQSQIQDADNAIAAVITPIVRGAGFSGCGGISNGVNSYLGTTATALTFETSSPVRGYTGTLPASVTDNAANDGSTGDWAPALDSSLSGDVEQGSDVVAFLGAVPFSKPDGIAAFATDLITVADNSLLQNAGAQVLAISDCAKSSLFMGTVNTGTGAVAFTTGPSPNGAPPGTVQYGISAQLVPAQQTVFYVGHAPDGNQSALWQGVMTPGANGASNAKWTLQEAVPGVIAMKVQYGVGSAEQSTEYVDAHLVTNWAQITTVKLAFLIEGSVGSSPIPKAAETFSLLGNTVTVPADSRLRHVFNMTINLRNSTL